MSVHEFSPSTTQKPTWIYEADATTAQFDNSVIKMGELASGTSNTANALIAFDLSSLAGTVVTATLTFTAPHDNGGSLNAADRTITVFRSRRAWTTAATWNKYDGTNDWTTPGGENGSPDFGDYDSTLNFGFNMLALLFDDMVIDDSAGLNAMIQDAIDNRSGLLSMIFRGHLAGNIANTEEWMSYFSSGIHLSVEMDNTPSTQAFDIVQEEILVETAELSWTRGTGSKCAVFVKQASSGAASPVNNTTYTANTSFGAGTQIGSTGWYCVYNGTGTTVTVADLMESTSYRVMVCEYNGIAGLEDYNTSSAANNPVTFTTEAGVVAPSKQASNVISIDTFTFALNLSWSRGSGSRCAAFMKEADSGSPEPADGTTYAYSENFGEGDQIGSSGWYCIYNGTENSALVLGLTADTTYRVMVCEYNGDDGSELFNSDPGDGNPANLDTLAESSNVESSYRTGLVRVRRATDNRYRKGV